MEVYFCRWSKRHNSSVVFSEASCVSVDRVRLRLCNDNEHHLILHLAFVLKVA